MRGPCAWLPDINKSSMPPLNPTPQERLALSRKAIVRHMTRSNLTDEETRSADSDPAEEQGHVRNGTFFVIKQALRMWWQRHPASTACSLAEPLIGKYAVEHPFKLLAFSAAVGAATAVLRPWRLVSIGGLLVTALKSSELTGALLSMLSSSSQATPNPEKFP